MFGVEAAIAAYASCAAEDEAFQEKLKHMTEHEKAEAIAKRERLRIEMIEERRHREMCNAIRSRNSSGLGFGLGFILGSIVN